ncbi:ARF GTPase-activating protein GIT2 [Armadillidium vulgare]|nr:ARF GTPase-activating protein GIT2 [Armadillidium vulgare]
MSILNLSEYHYKTIVSFIIFQMVQTLNSSGANHIWEHTLLDPSTSKGVRRKPQPSDPVHPNKADFIRAKHQLMSFVYRPNRDENLASGDKDVSRQLHASVRTANLETSLRLLSLGADPNYYSTEKGNCPIHVAVTAGQSCQVELLVTYGADPGAFDKDGLTPVDYAREGGFSDIADRLVELQYELTDRLAFYLCNKKADHKNGLHWIIPELADSPTEISDVAKEAKSKLVALPHHSFEELACDVYDEVDRRETDAIWLSPQNQSPLLSDRCSVPFLPVNPEYSSTRNQGRQKLARFNAREFATLIIDILVEARRRMAGTQYQITDKNNVDVTVTVTTPPAHSTHLTTTDTISASVVTNNSASASQQRQTCPTLSSRQDHNHPTLGTSTTATSQSQPVLSSHSTPPSSLNSPFHSTIPLPNTTCHQRPSETDEDPLYDSVASEDDYSSWERKKKMQNQQELLAQQSKALKNNFHDSDYQEVVDSPERKIRERDKPATVSLNDYLEMKRYLELSESRIKELRDNNIVMTAKLNELSSMIHTLKEENDCLRLQGSSPSLVAKNTPVPISGTPYLPPNSPHHVTNSVQGRSYSPFYDSPSHTFQNGDCSIRKGDSGAAVASSDAGLAKPQRPFSMFEARGRPQQQQQQHQSFSSYSDKVDNPYVYDSGSKNNESQVEINTSLISSLPTQDEVVRKTEVITKRIQELLLSAQDCQHERFLPCADQINVAARDMSELFPKSGVPPEIRTAVHQLLISATRLQSECRTHLTSQLHILDPSRVTQQVIQCAYDIAKAAKNLSCYVSLLNFINFARKEQERHY